MPRRVLKLNFTSDGGDTYPGWDRMRPADTTAKAAGVDGDLAVRTLVAPISANDRDSGSSPDEMRDSNWASPNQGGLANQAQIRQLVGSKTYRLVITAGDPDNAGRHSVRVGTTSPTVTVMLDLLTVGAEWVQRSVNIAASSGGILVIAGGQAGGFAGDTHLAGLEIWDDAVASSDELIATVVDEVDAVPSVPVVYDHRHSFPDQKSTRDAGTVTLLDGTDRLRLAFVAHESSTDGFTNGTNEVIHVLTVTLLQAFAGGVNDAQRISEVETRKLAEEVAAVLRDGRVTSAMGLAVGQGWLGFRSDGMPNIRPMQAVSFNGDTWSKVDVIIRVSEEVSI